MRRPLGVIGLVYLSSLAVIFHFYSQLLTAVISVAAAAAVAAAVAVKLIKRRSRAGFAVIAAGLSVLFAVLSFSAFTRFRVEPILENYSDKEIYIEGYVCDELSYNDASVTCTVQTEKINGEPVKTKISLLLTGDLDVEAFDRVSARIKTKPANYNYLLSRGIFLYAAEGENSEFSASHEKHISPYYYAVMLRQKIKSVFNSSLDKNASAMSRAVLLGDKKALPYEVRKAFSDTGVSYLIVVSGMHLAIVTLFLRRLFDRVRLNNTAAFVLITLFVLMFIALTGFTPSVVRSGIMMILFYLSRLLLRDCDSFNSLGIAALALTVTNPFSVGDIGMLLSFAATFGILLWADKISGYLIGLLRLSEKERKQSDSKLSLRRRVWLSIRRALRKVIILVSVSAAATLWVIPITIIFFGSVTPFTPLISIIAYPLTFAILISALVFAVFGLFGIVLFPPAALLNALSGLLINFVCGCSKNGLLRIKAEDGYFFIWIAVSFTLVAVGYLIRARKPYIIFSIAVSLLTLTIGWSLTEMFADRSASLTIFRSGSGYTAAVRKDANLSLLSCGGSAKGRSNVIDELRRSDTVDNIVLAGGENKNYACFGEISDGFAVKNILMFGENFDTHLVSDEEVHFFEDNTSFELELNSDVSVRVIAVNGRVFQYVSSQNVSVLIVPEKARLGDLPEEYRTADYALFEGNAYDPELLGCGRLLSVSGKPLNGAKPEIISEEKPFRIKLD